MTCKRWEPLYSSFLDGEMSPGEEQAFRNHLGHCVSCREATDSLRQLSKMLSVSVETDPGFVARFRTRRNEELEPAGSGFVWRWLAVRLAPMALAAVAVAAAVVWSSEPEPDLRELEASELGIGLSAEYEETALMNPVLSIALDPFPESEP
ncbi:MAG: anti-sigma factor family protein [Vicinamibacteria bacterium]